MWIWWTSLGGLVAVIALIGLFWPNNTNDTPATTVALGTTTTTGAVSTTSPIAPATTTAAPVQPMPVTLTYTFANGADGWTPGFADYPDDNQELYELEAAWRRLPDELGGTGLYSRGSNRSDDLIMYWYRRVDGLVPGRDFDAEFILELATNVPSGLIGIGGSPTDALFVKVGAATAEPSVTRDEQGFLRLTIDVGAQSEGGADAVVIGNLNNPNVDPEAAVPPYAFLEVDGTGRPVGVTADASGAVWALVGIDSGFEGATAVYISEIRVTLTPHEG